MAWMGRSKGNVGAKPQKKPAPIVPTPAAAQTFLDKMHKKSGLIAGPGGKLQARPGRDMIRRVRST